MINFYDLRSALIAIRRAVGQDYLVSLSWDGQNLKVVAANPPTGMLPFVMTFDSEDDFTIKSEVLLSQFAEGVTAYFGTAKQQSQQLEILLHRASQK